MPNTIQSGEHSTGSGLGGAPYDFGLGRQLERLCCVPRRRRLVARGVLERSRGLLGSSFLVRVCCLRVGLGALTLCSSPLTVSPLRFVCAEGFFFVRAQEVVGESCGWLWLPTTESSIHTSRASLVTEGNPSTLRQNSGRASSGHNVFISSGEVKVRVSSRQGFFEDTRKRR